MSNLDIDEFVQGSMDCAMGIPHEEGKSESYDKGYAEQYELDQKQGATSSE